MPTTRADGAVVLMFREGCVRDREDGDDDDAPRGERRTTTRGWMTTCRRRRLGENRQVHEGLGFGAPSSPTHLP